MARGDSAKEAAAAAASPPPPSAGQKVGPVPTAEQAAAGLAECLHLLKGPTDERRFVGLLLVTKLLPAGDAEAVRQVHAAVGNTFLTRLLLPLKTTAPPPPPPSDSAASNSDAAAAAQQAQQAAATCALGLAVLSSFARVPELAASEEMLEKLPLLLNVVRAGGIGPLLAARHAAGPSGRATSGSGGFSGISSGNDNAAEAGAAVDQAADAAAVLDALECAVAVAQSGPVGAAVAAECGALGAAVATLRGFPPHATQQLSLALQLLAAVLADEGRRAQVLAGDRAAVLQQLLPALARVFALPAEQLRGRGQGSGSGGGQDDELQRRLLAVQLEALHVLLLVLPLPAGSTAVLQGQLSSAGWTAQLRQGLALLLRGRISAVQRHSALQLAAAVVDLTGPGWLLGGLVGGSAAAGSVAARGTAAAEAAEVQAFYQLLVEITKVETSVLLHDALAPDVPVPLASAAAPAAGEWRPPVPRQPATSEAGSSEAGDGDDVAGPALAADLAGGEAGGEERAADLEPLVRVLSSEEDRRQMEAQLRREQQEAETRDAAAPGGGQKQGEHMRRVDATPIPTDMRWEGPTEASGARAARVLPCCFSLLEACVEALAADTQRAEAMLEGGCGPGSGAAQPVLSDSVAQRALFSLQEAVEVVLQFIEQTACSEQEGQEEQEEQEGQEGQEGQEEDEVLPAVSAGLDTSSLVRRALLLAALRVLARFCAEVPEAFAPRLRPLLPHLLPLRIGFRVGGSEEMELEAEPPEPAEGTMFLLPMLLLVSDPALAAHDEQHERERQLWLDALAEPAVLRQLTRYACQCAASCAPAVTTAAAEAADDALLYACQLLLNILADEVPEAVVARQQEDARERRQGRCRQLLLAVEPLLLLRELLRVAQMRPLQAPQDCSPADVAATARLLSALAALCATVAASVAAELDCAAASSTGLRLQLSAEEQTQQVALEAAAEAAAAAGRPGALSRRPEATPGTACTAQALPPGSPLPFLGPISGRLMQTLCTQLLAAIQLAAQLLAPTAPLAGGDRQLALARSAVAADDAMQAELLRQLDVAAAAAALLLWHYPPFEAMCEDSAWLAGELAGGAELAPAPAGSGAATVSTGLALFLSVLTDVMRG